MGSVDGSVTNSPVMSDPVDMTEHPVFAGGLTEAQRRFAHGHRATAIMRSELNGASVFMYSSDALRTFRWLVDADGDAIETASFRCAPVA
jgi:hypothetical protein